MRHSATALLVFAAAALTSVSMPGCQVPPRNAPPDGAPSDPAAKAAPVTPANDPAHGPAAADPKPPAPPVALPIYHRDVEYYDGGTVLRGHLAWPKSEDELMKWPAVLVVHEWWGRGSHADRTAERLAQLGYVALAIDMYGQGKTAKDAEEAGKLADEFRKDPVKARQRLRAAVDYVRGLTQTDWTRVACIGFCFGGTMSLEAAWAGLDLRAVVSFHGNLTTPTKAEADKCKAAVLVLHGADDTLVSDESIAAFQKAMRDNALDWQFVSYGRAVHSFTNPEADGTRNPLVKFDERAARRSFEAMKDFLAERFTELPGTQPAAPWKK